MPSKGQFKPIKDSFHSRYVKDAVSGCWNWLGYTTSDGHGTAHHEGKGWMAHRLSWYLHRGPFDLSLKICHRCDNPKCVNPNHLFIGTHQDNQYDKISKGRQAKGSGHGRAKLTEQDVRRIRTEKCGILPSALAREYKITLRAMINVINGITWKHI